MSKEAIAKETLDSWRINSSVWDEGVGQDGNIYWKELQKPCLTRMLGDHFKPNCQALELATGNGLCARWMAAHGAEVLATDGTEEMLAVASPRVAEGDRIVFQKLDVTHSGDFDVLVEAGRQFDIVLMNMAIMDVPEIEPFAKVLPRLLKVGGVCVISMLHPVFHTPRTYRIVEIKDDHETQGREILRKKVIPAYLSVPPWKGYAIPSQPVLQYYFHRPLHELFGTFFKRGLVMDSLEEPAFPENFEHPNKERAESTLNFSQFPPLMAFRFRRAA